MAPLDIPFPEITFVSRLLGNNVTAIAKQEALKKEAENNEGAPKIYNVSWVVGEERIQSSRIFNEVKVRAYVLNIPEGNSVSFEIKRPIQTNNTTNPENEEDVITLTGTVKNKMVEVTWEIEKAPEEGSQEQENES